jgi:threonine/homoserine/homoserine lactone efflux protein
MGPEDILALSVVMALLALMPSASVALVVARSASAGVADGLAVVAGIVLGDLVLVLLAVFGLAVIAEVAGGAFVLVRYLGGAYLIWLGIRLIRQSERSQSLRPATSRPMPLAGFAAGLLLTLSDLKALAFYLSVLPLFVDLARLSAVEVAWLCLVTVLSVGAVKLGYALAANRVMRWARRRRLESAAGRVSGVAILCAGGGVILKA